MRNDDKEMRMGFGEIFDGKSMKIMKFFLVNCVRKMFGFWPKRGLFL
jgi:hypothetical protein